MTTALTLEELDAHLKAKKRVYFVSFSSPTMGIVHHSRTSLKSPTMGIVHHSRTSLKDVNEFLPHMHFYSNYFHAYAHFLKLNQKDIKAESCSAT